MKSLLSISAATLLALTSIPAKALDDNLVYVSVPPCRIADTRTTQGGTGPLAAGEERAFKVYGDLSGQGGDVCEQPRADGVEPLAASVYLVAVGGGVKNRGFLTAFPTDEVPGTVATLNYDKNQVIGNTTIVTLCQPGSCPTDGQLGLTSSDSQNVVMDIQGYFYPAAGSCSDDMVAAGSLCVDKFEASLVDSGGNSTTAAACLPDGSDCAGVIFAQSAPGVTPAASITLYQAAIACANAGKRLPTTTEWQMAAAGTPSGTGDGTSGCNSNSGNSIGNTGSAPSCVSSVGAFDMVGNVWEWVDELGTPPAGVDFTTTDDDAIARAMGESYSNAGSPITPSIKSLFFLDNIGDSGPNAQNPQIGFRCVR